MRPTSMTAARPIWNSTPADFLSDEMKRPSESMPDPPRDGDGAVVARIERAADGGGHLGADAGGDGPRDGGASTTVTRHRSRTPRASSRSRTWALSPGRARPRAVRRLREDERPALGSERPVDRFVHGQEVGDESPPALPGLPGELSDHRLDLGGAPAPVDDRHDAEPCVRDVEPGLDWEQRDGEDPRPRLEALGLGHEPGHRLVTGPLPSAGTSMGERAKSVTGPHLAAHRPEEERRRLRAGLVEVDVRVGVVADERVRLLDHPGRDGGVEVQRRDQGDGGADGLPHRGEELALAVRRVLEHHGAVEREEHAVDRSRRREPLEERALHVLERLPGSPVPTRRRWPRPSGAPPRRRGRARRGTRPPRPASPGAAPRSRRRRGAGWRGSARGPRAGGRRCWTPP